MATTRSIRQNSKIADVTYIIGMEVEEARRRTNAIRDNLVAACESLLEMHERQGWRALGYQSWREWAQQELDLSKTRGYERLAFARVRRNLKALATENSAIAEKAASELNEAQARVLATLPAEAQSEVYMRAVKATNGKLTAQAVAAQAELVKRQTRAVPKRGSGKPKGQHERRERLVKWAREAPMDAVEPVLRLLERGSAVE